MVQNLELCNGRALIQPPAEVLIQKDASTKGWGATCNGISTGRKRSAQEMKNHINVLETGYTNVFENLEAQSHSFPGGQHGSFDIYVKDGGYQNLKLIQLAKEI